MGQANSFQPDKSSSSSANEVPIKTRDDFSHLLLDLKKQSSYTYKKLGQLIDRPTTTIHGWFTGLHLPYQRDTDDFERLLALLGVGDAQRVITQLDDLRQQPATQAANPYRGLEPFTESHGDIYFGREQLLAETLGVLSALPAGPSSHPLVVVGASGSGKSSFLRAGLVLALKDAKKHSTAYVTPGTTPEQTIQAAIKSLGEPDSSSDGSETPELQGLLIVDQFEELFIADGEDVLDTCTTMLSKASRELKIQIVIGLRSDLFHRAAALDFVSKGLKRSQVLVEGLTLDQATMSIVGPAQHVGLSVEPDLLARLVADFGSHLDSGASGEVLPLLSHALYLVAEQPEGKKLTLERYEAAGGLRHALEQSAEDAFATLDTVDQRVCHQLYSQLVELDAVDASPTRRPSNLADLESISPDAEIDFEPVLSEFVKARLLTLGVDSVQISHESLLGAWPRLASWIDEEREALLAIRRLKNTTALWSESDEHADTLLTGTQLEPATALSQDPKHRAKLSKDDERFILQSEALSTRKTKSKRRRTQSLLALAAVATVAALGAGVFAVRANQASDRAEVARAEALSRQLALQSSTIMETDPSLGRQLALIAHEVSQTVEARSAVIDASATSASSRYLGGAGATAFGFSNDGEVLAYSNSVEGTITVLIPQDGQYVPRSTYETFDITQDVYALALSADGSTMATGGTDMYVSSWDLDGPNPEPVIMDDSKTLFSGAIQSIEISSDGQTIYGAGTGGGIGVWDVATGETSSELIALEGAIMSLALDHSESLLASASQEGTIRLWSLADTSEPLWSTPSINETFANTVTLSDDGTQMAAGYRDGKVRIWDITDPSAPIEVEFDAPAFGSWTDGVHFSPDGSKLAAGASDGLVRIWDTTTLQQLGPDLQHPTVVTAISFVRDDFLIASVADGSLRTWQLDNTSMDSLGASIWSATFDTSGTRLLSSSGKRAGIWNFESGEPVLETRDILAPEDFALTGGSAIAPDGERAAFGTRTGEVLLVPLDAETGETQILLGLTALVENVAFSNDNSLLGATADDSRVSLWTLNSDGSTTSLGLQETLGLAMNLDFSPDSKTLAVVDDTGTLYIYNTSDVEDIVEVATAITGESIGLSVAFHPSKPWLATGNADATISIWDYSDLSDLQMLGEVTGPNTRIYALDFDNSGDQLAAGIGDNTAWIWDISNFGSTANAQRKTVLSAASQAVFTVRFSPDSKYLIAGGADRHLFIWNLDDESVQTQVCAAVGDQITEEEWRDLVSPLDYSPPCE